MSHIFTSSVEWAAVGVYFQQLAMLCQRAVLVHGEVITEGTEANGLCVHPESFKAFFETFRRFLGIL